MTIPKINSSHGSETRNIINTAIDSINAQGKSIQDLVAEGQLTPAQYAQLITIVNGNVKKGNITTADIDKNNFLVDQTMISETLLQQIAGTTEINAVPANYSITSIKLADGSVTKSKKRVGGEFASVVYEGQKPNIDTINKTLTFYGPYHIYYSKNRAVISADQVLSFPTGASALIVYDVVENTFRITNAGNISAVGEDEVVLMYVIFTSASQKEVKTVICNFDYTVNGVVRHDIEVTTEMIPNKSITPIKTNFIKRSSNILKLENSLKNHSTDVDTGEPVANVTSDLTDYIEVTPGETVTATNTGRVAYYSEKNVSSFLYSHASTGTFTIPMDCRYIRVAVQHTRMRTAKINIGNEALPYEPYYLKLDGIDGIEKPDIKHQNRFVKPLPSNEIYSAPLLPDISDGTENTIKKLSSSDIYSMYDELATSYPHYISSTLLGNEPTGKPIYRYDFKRSDNPDTQNEYVEIPKMFIVSGTHGSEKTAVYTCYQVMKQLCEAWDSNEGLESVRWNVHIIVIPLANPWAWDVPNANFPELYGGSRVNSNGVDLARNFAGGWSFGGEGTDVYSGTSPQSEIEAQLIDAELEKEKDNLIYVCDFHNFFDPKSFMWNASATDFHVNLFDHLSIKMSGKWKAEHDFFPQDETTYMGLAAQTGAHGSPGGSLGFHAVETYNVQGGSFEVCETNKWEPESTRKRNSQNTIKLAMESFFNWLNIVYKNEVGE